MFDATVGSVNVHATNGRGSTPEEVAERCVNKLIGISNNANPILRDQAVAYRNEMEKVIVVYMKQAVQSDRTTVYNAIRDAGQLKLAEYIKDM
jgi:hypothetical protein|tara:strand:+ start:4835 stop:5113 length:279 start_codon:yes stop_codon:yes gene_type:complete